jgi:hypothetical protein
MAVDLTSTEASQPAGSAFPAWAEAVRELFKASVRGVAEAANWPFGATMAAARRLGVMSVAPDEQQMHRNFNLISDWPDSMDLREHGHGGGGKDDWSDDSTSLSPLYDRGGGISIYSGPSGPIGKLARIELNRIEGRELNDGLGDAPFSRAYPLEAPSAGLLAGAPESEPEPVGD